MKKTFLVLTMSIVLIFSGCSATKPNAESPSTRQDDAAKSCKIEVLSAQDDTLLTTINDQDRINIFLHTDEWKAVVPPTQILVPEFKLVVYQEKTLLAGQDSNAERGYEIIEIITTYQDTSQIEEAISQDIIKNMKVPDEFLTVNYIVPDEMISNLKQLVKSE